MPERVLLCKRLVISTIWRYIGQEGYWVRCQTADIYRRGMCLNGDHRAQKWISVRTKSQRKNFLGGKPVKAAMVATARSI